jgi:arylsulfatase
LLRATRAFYVARSEHGLTEKWYPFEESLRVPLVIQDPRMPKELRGTRNKEMTLNVDLAPTLLGAAQIPPSHFMQGRDIGRLYLGGEGKNVKWRKDWFYEFNMGRNVTDAEDHPQRGWIDASFALITDEWKYIYWPQQDYEQLFHRSLDPYDEWDLLDKRVNHTDRHRQTTIEVYDKMKARFHQLKARVQSGHPV